MVFTAYFDELNTHGPAPTIILAAYMGNVAQWTKFAKRLIKLQKKYRFTIFHAKDFNARANEFSGWSWDKRRLLVEDLAYAVSKLPHGVTISLSRERYMKEYRSPPSPKKIHFDSQYGICFRACLARFLDLLRDGKNLDKLNIVIEGGHKNVNDCIRIFNDARDRSQRQGEFILGTCKIARKKDCIPLMVADFLAFAHGRGRSAEDRAKDPELSFAPDKKPTKQGWISTLELPPNALFDLKANWEKERLLDIERRRTEF